MMAKVNIGLAMVCCSINLIAACTRPPSSGLVIRAPSRLSQAVTSEDQALCDQLRVELTFDRVDDTGSPPLDRVELAPKPDTVCTWVLQEEAELQRGTYDLVVRFLTKETAATCAAPSLVGAYVKRDLAFPFADDFEGLTDADFYSRPGEEGPLEEDGLSFDPDEDGRDNLAETAVGSDPCKQNSVPVATVQAPTSGDEGAVMTLRLETTDVDGVDHRVILRITHANDLQARPEYSTTEIAFAALTSDAAHPTVTPSVLEQPERERWSVVSRVLSSGPGAAVWEVDFTPDEPFVGSLALELVVDDGYGNPLGQPVPASAEVGNQEDLPTLLFEGADGEAPATELSFAEAGNHPSTVHRFRFQDDDLDADASAWSPQLVAPSLPGLSLSQDIGYWALMWSPSNAEALAEPSAGYDATIEFLDQGAQVFDQTALSLFVDPRWNNDPTIEPPATGELSLPVGDFGSHSIYFAVLDPDQVTTAPTCAVEITPDGSTTCTSPFSSVRCEPRSPRDGERWAFQLVLETAADYVSACGDAPRFLATLSITDAAPPGASNGPVTVSAAALSLRTAEVVSGAVVGGGPAEVPDFFDAFHAVVLGSVPAALVHLESGSPDYADVVTVLDLGFPTPQTVAQLDVNELCSLQDARPRDIGIADEANQRVLVYGQRRDGDYCNGDRVVAVVGLGDPGNPTMTAHLEADVCTSISRPGNPVKDSADNLYVPCGREPGKLVRFDSAGAMSSATIAELSNSCNCMDNDENAVIVTPGGDELLIWPDLGGIMLVDLTTFDQATPTVSRVDMGVDWDPDDVSDHAVDAARSSYTFVKQTTGDAELWRLVFGSSLPPTVEGPLTLSNNGGERLVLRQPGSEPPNGVDLVVDGTSSGDDRPYIDLDTWQVVESRPALDFYGIGYSPGLYPSPDRRYFVMPSTSSYEDSMLKGVYLFSWDPSVPRRFLDLGLPAGTFDDEERVTVSMSGDLMVYCESPTYVIYFRDAAQGLD